jgi:hypothetical protein
MLMSIAEARTAAAAPLVERHLADPVYDVWAQNETRAAAAWAARRLGGKRMAQALRESAVRRDGRDWATLVYLAILERGAAVETLKVLRSRRLRYPEPLFGGEEPQLNVIIEDLTGGRTLARFDLPPERLAGL